MKPKAQKVEHTKGGVMNELIIQELGRQHYRQLLQDGRTQYVILHGGKTSLGLKRELTRLLGLIRLMMLNS